MSRTAVSLLLRVIVIAAAGCGPSGPPTGLVHGEVRLDGVPLPDGYVTFFSRDDSRAPAGGPIREGRFSVTVPAGPVRVEVRSLEVIRPARLPEDEGEARERVPARYNSRGGLPYEVREGDNPVTFDLTRHP